MNKFEYIKFEHYSVKDWIDYGVMFFIRILIGAVLLGITNNLIVDIIIIYYVFNVVAEDIIYLFIMANKWLFRGKSKK